MRAYKRKLTDDEWPPLFQKQPKNRKGNSK